MADPSGIQRILGPFSLFYSPVGCMVVMSEAYGLWSAPYTPMGGRFRFCLWNRNNRIHWGVGFWYEATHTHRFHWVSVQSMGICFLDANIIATTYLTLQGLQDPGKWTPTRLYPWEFRQISCCSCESRWQIIERPLMVTGCRFHPQGAETRTMVPAVISLVEIA